MMLKLDNASWYFAVFNFLHDSSEIFLPLDIRKMSWPKFYQSSLSMMSPMVSIEMSPVVSIGMSPIVSIEQCKKCQTVAFNQLGLK